MEYVFDASNPVYPNDSICKLTAVENVRRLESAIDHVLERFETSPNFKLFYCDNEWINHPDEYYVEANVFKNIFKNSFGNITLDHFLTNFSFDGDNVSMLIDFVKSCDILYSKLSYDEVECAFNQIVALHARLAYDGV